MYNVHGCEHILATVSMWGSVQNVSDLCDAGLADGGYNMLSESSRLNLCETRL